MRYHQDVDDEGVLERGIAGDEEEQHRIELEQNLRDLSIPLSLSNPSQDSDQEQYDDHGFGGRHHQSFNTTDSSLEVEIPRHDPRPPETSIFHGHDSSIFDQSHMDNDYEDHYYSYRTRDEEEGFNPFGFDTMSTAAHHASAVTLSAGLRGRGGRYHHKSDASLSGAEFDPDRPIDRMVNGIAGELSMLNVNATPRSKRLGNTGHSVTFDPLAFDHSRHHHSHSTTSDSEPRTPDNEPLSHRSMANGFSPSYHSGHFSHDFDATPKAKSRGAPQFNVEPPTPSAHNSSGSKFAKLARNLAKDIEASQNWAGGTVKSNASPVHSTTRQNKKSRSTPRKVFQNIANNLPIDEVEEVPPYSNRSSRHSGLKHVSENKLQAARRDERSYSQHVQLPDVTGLTSAVGSPPRKDLDWRTYSGRSDSDAVEGQLLQTITVLQTRLNQLESQNLVSRRRVRELEHELEACKTEVKRERTRVLEREQIIVAQQKDSQKRRDATKKASRPSAGYVDEQRYREVVEEKKALEALVGTLRSHLSRLTEELSTQRALLDELRSLRQADSETLRQKMVEVDALRSDVDRLEGEVEVLRGVVEEGVRERQRAKEASMSLAANPPTEDESVVDAHDDDQVSEHESVQERSILEGDARRRPTMSKSQGKRAQHAYDKTMRTDYATVGSSQIDAGRSTRFVDNEEVEQMMIDVEERKSNRSGSSTRSLNMSHDVEGDRTAGANTSLRNASMPNRSLDEESLAESRPSRPTRPQPSRAKKQNNNPTSEAPEDIKSTPFPQIRGERLEKLFFSAPEHNEKTCRVCHRRQRPNMDEDGIDAPSWVPPRKRAKVRVDEQATNPRNDDVRMDGNSMNAFARDRLPPQTVLVRVLRELEDDFTHYKGIYTELADQYKIMDAVSNVPKRNVLAEHLKDVINTLEQKGDQIASLYDLLTFKDKPTSESVVPDRPATRMSPRRVSSSRLKPFSNRTGGLKKHATYS